MPESNLYARKLSICQKVTFTPYSNIYAIGCRHWHTGQCHEPNYILQARTQEKQRFSRSFALRPGFASSVSYGRASAKTPLAQSTCVSHRACVNSLGVVTWLFLASDRIYNNLHHVACASRTLSGFPRCQLSENFFYFNFNLHALRVTDYIRGQRRRHRMEDKHFQKQKLYQPLLERQLTPAR